MELPNDPAMLVSYINMKLRDEYPSLDELCDSLDIDKEELISRLADASFEYVKEQNRFI